MKTASLTLAVLALTLTGCKPDAAVRTGATLDKGYQPVSATPANAGTVTGVVHFAGKAPDRVPIDMSMDPACSMLSGDSKTEQYVVADGKLANTFVYIKSYTGPAMGNPSMHAVLDQKGCRYNPHVIAIYKGGSVDFKNSDPTMHNIHISVGDQTMDVSQGPMAAMQSRQFNTPQIMTTVRCNNHPWMEAFLNVSPTPWFAVTGTDGSFTLNGVPPGTYTVAAVHEKLGEQDETVTVPASGTAKADITFQAK